SITQLWNEVVLFTHLFVERMKSVKKILTEHFFLIWVGKTGAGQIWIKSGACTPSLRLKVRKSDFRLVYYLISTGIWPAFQNLGPKFRIAFFFNFYFYKSTRLKSKVQ
ncbi:MAG: hypothetical protein ABI844_01195, partial [Saprospiraceae bacterium]